MEIIQKYVITKLPYFKHLTYHSLDACFRNAIKDLNEVLSVNNHIKVIRETLTFEEILAAVQVSSATFFENIFPVLLLILRRHLP